MKQPLFRFWLFNSSILFYLLHSNATTAQIVPDATLPVNSSVMQQGNTSIIEGGTTAGTNLFHSFKDFSVPNGAEAFFNNALEIQNIFSRVTGGNISNIDGLIRANGVANLFLINPNGIIFGPNARLNIGGSFLASTASSIRFADGIEFSATNTNAPPLLTINVPIGLQFGSNSSGLNGAIAVQGAGHNLSIDPDTLVIIRDNRPIGFGVLPNQTLALVGGDLTLDGGNLTASSGRIELGSVAPGSLVTLMPTNSGWQLGYEGVQNFQDISLTNAASVDASGSGGGSIQVQGRRVTLADGAAILNLTEGSNSGGNLIIRASESVELIGTKADGEFLRSLTTDTQPKATGIAGDLIIETARLTIRDGAQVSASTFGQGNAGNLTIKATDSVELIGTSADGKASSGLFASTQPKATGIAGDLIIETARLTIRDGAQVSASTFGQGNAGNLTIKATDSVELIGTSADGKASSGLFASANQGSIGDGGNLIVETGRLTVGDGAFINTGTFGPGKAGNLTVKARDSIELADGLYGSGLFASADVGSTGDGGDLIIETGRLIVRDGAQISVSTLGQGKAGNLLVKAVNLVEVIGESADSKRGSGLFASAEQGSTGDGGNLIIETGRLIVRDGAFISIDTLGPGKGGTLLVKAADSVEVIGTSPDGKAPSALFAPTSPGTTGDGGDLMIETGRLIVRDGAQIGAGTFGQGKAGTLTVRARDSVEVIGTTADGQIPSGLFTSAQRGSTGDGNDLMIETGRLIVRDGAVVSVNSLAVGKAGTLRVFADSIELYNKGSLNANTKAGGGSIDLRSSTITLHNSSITTNATGGERGGDIIIGSQFLQLRDNSTITTNAEGIEVKGGNITLNTDILAALENSDITANAQEGKGGEITINADAIFGSVARTRAEIELLLNTKDADPRQLFTSDITAISQQESPEFQGTVTVNTPDVDPSSGLIELPVDFVDPTRLIAQGCPANRGNSFIVTGRGGLPPSPNELLRANNTVSVDWVTRDSESIDAGDSLSGGAGEIVEATGWIINEKGQMVLIASRPNSTHNRFLLTPSSCPETVESR